MIGNTLHERNAPFKRGRASPNGGCTGGSNMASTDIAFSPSVKAVQERRGSRGAYARLEQNGGWETKIDAVLAKFIAGLRSFYLATASKDGQPYVQHRGGPPGFLRVIDETTLAFADFAGNRQYISTGNLAENPRAMLFLMDYQNRRRVKIWGQARVIENDPRVDRASVPGRLSGAPRGRDPVHRRGLGCELSATHPANAVRRGCGCRHRCARGAHRRARGGECPASRQG